ncbi:MAG: hypothetical protein KDA89_19170, partial [Planctomycetaceae bacterium]|nr:hypothetical protein [Planctomycetaceae bacterium]
RRESLHGVGHRPSYLPVELLGNAYPLPQDGQWPSFRRKVGRIHQIAAVVTPHIAAESVSGHDDVVQCQRMRRRVRKASMRPSRAIAGVSTALEDSRTETIVARVPDRISKSVPGKWANLLTVSVFPGSQFRF